MSAVFRHLARLFSTAADPASPAAGDLWWRSDAAQAHVSDGEPGLPVRVGPFGNLPVVRSGAWHSLPPQGNSGTATVPADRLFALPLWPGRASTLTAVAVNVTLALAGGNIRMGLYASDGALPASLVADYGTVSVGVTGIRQISGLSTALRPVLYYLGVVRQGGVLNLGLSARDTWEPVISETSPVLDTNRNTYYRDGVGGTLPSSFGPPVGSAPGPSAALQLT